ncbi:MAG: phosphodiester glycosidase family protein [Clostridia bacterium]|nr:phosphodiester glycosidase family protein [Clostridia bacterium]
MQKKKKEVRTSVLKKILIFLVFEMVFTAITMPLFVFYGPFTELKKAVVGRGMNSLNHQYIPKFFLSDQAIWRILGDSFAIDPVEAGEEVKVLNFGGKHTDKIEVYNIDGGDFTGKMMVIYDPTKVVIGYSGQMPKAGEVTSAIAKKNRAIAAINAGGFMDVQWSGTGGAPMGFIIHDGKVVYNQLKSEKVRQDTAAFTEEGMLIVGKHSIEQLKKLKIKEGVSFGPPLIVNGKTTIKKGDGGWGKAPRTAIGQRESGEVLFLVIDGRRNGFSGATLRDVQDILLQYKAVNAVNLDGGSSTTMYFGGKVINTPSDALGERAVPTVFMVLPGEGSESK